MQCYIIAKALEPVWLVRPLLDHFSADFPNLLLFMLILYVFLFPNQILVDYLYIGKTAHRNLQFKVLR